MAKTNSTDNVFEKSCFAMVPIILRATEQEASGALMQVGGLRVVDRAIRLLARLRDAHVVIASDGSIPLPRRLPPDERL